ncbi:CAAX amino terminal protease self- immunity [Nocardioides dokdonensis FR1436]|uniref:CAAX amino terminal protease self-immunity n=1 Tax=Nocardioides dokdonensis FR1436 TaxID=1300347 RepID=A0A1A9GIW3_9ACTN|nr:CAAX amino terminal protease self- immunity [Nocardioides dokdonensis FR1436]
MREFVRRSLWEVVPRDHQQTPTALRRRQLVTIGFVLVGAVVLGFSLRTDPGSSDFYLATLVLAAVWAVGAFTSGPLHLGRISRGEGLRRPVLSPILLGVLLVAVFTVGALVIREVSLADPLVRQIRSVLRYTEQTPIALLVFVTALNGIAEELFFRGAAFAAVTRHPVTVTTVAYTVATLATGNVMLSFAAVLLGVVVGLQRRASGGILAPILTHLTWSLSMLFLLPLIYL